MIRWQHSTIAALGFIISVSPASALTVWQGEAVILSATGTCTFPGDERRNIGVGTVLKSVLRPRLVDNNGNDTRVSFIHDSGALFAIFLPNGAMPSGNFAAFGATHSGLIVANRFGTYSGFRQTPPTLTTQTFAQLNGTAEDFMFLDGCSATFRATYSKR
jgi:hypothetical protein